METNGNFPEGALQRIADALERLAPPPRDCDWTAHPAYLWDGNGALDVPAIAGPELAELHAIARQKARVSQNVARHAAGAEAHDMLLWGARGMGKSALVRASVAAAQKAHPGAIALVQVAGGGPAGLARLFRELSQVERRFLVYLDDLGFGDAEDAAARQLRSWLDGGIAERPGNIRLAVTSNRRAIVPRRAAEQDDPLSPRDAVDDRLALADRFGLVAGFHACSQEEYLAIVAGYADPRGLAWSREEALEWAAQRGARSGRIARHYAAELAGQAGGTL